MKKIILIPILLFSFVLHAQNLNNLKVDNQQLKEENRRLESKIELLQQEINNIKNTLNIKADKTQLETEIDSLKKNYEQMIYNIENNINSYTFQLQDGFKISLNKGDEIEKLEFENYI